MRNPKDEKSAERAPVTPPPLPPDFPDIPQNPPSKLQPAPRLWHSAFKYAGQSGWHDGLIVG